MLKAEKGEESYLLKYLFSYIVDFCPTPPPRTGTNDEQLLLIGHKFN